MAMIENQVFLTRKGYEQKQERLEHCLYLLYEIIPKRLKLAKGNYYELSENREYIDIEGERELLKAEARRLETLLDKARIIEEHAINVDSIGLGAWVILEIEGRPGKQLVLELVSPEEVDLERNCISTASPLGQLLLGKKKGNKVKINTASGTTTYKVIGIRRTP